MNAIKKILRSIWAVWGVIVFGTVLVLTLPVAFVSFVFFKEKGVSFIIWQGYNFEAKFILAMCGIIVRNYGKEKVPKGKTYVIASNHQSQLDILVNAASTPSLYKFLSKAEAAKIPLLGYIIRNACILIDRSNKASKQAGFEAMEKTIRDGYSVLIYPEGTRNRTQEPLKNMYDGAFRLAILTQTPLLVTTLVGAGKLSNPHRTVDLAPGFIRSYWDAPISTEGMTEEDIPRLREQVRQIMLGHLKNSTPS